MIAGVEKNSLVDYPGKIACTVFTQGCNFRCMYCHNPSLIESCSKSFDFDAFYSFLKRRTRWLDGVCITGGEPTLHKKLPDIVNKIKELGFLVKLDTNGSNPAMLKKLLGAVDFIAMDIKSSPEQYSKVTGVYVDMANIKESVDLIRNSGVDYEFRTTIVPALFNITILEGICKWLSGSEKFVIQQFVPGNCLSASFNDKPAFLKEDVLGFKKFAEKFFKNVGVRGV